MKQIGINLDDETIKQMQELAERWGLPDVRHNTAVISRCVERVWQQVIGIELQVPEDTQTVTH